MAEPCAAILSLAEHFAALEDPRVERTKLHPLVPIIVIALCAVICGAESWDEIAAFGEAKETWLQSFLDLPNGIPSHDTFNRVFAALDPQQFQVCFVAWMQAVTEVLPAQVKVYDKSNEITAIPELLRALAIHGCIVTIDAMGCQRAIAQQTLDQGADYVLALKGNQGTLYTDVVEMFAKAQANAIDELAIDEARSVTKGHGRIEIRRCRVISDPDVLERLQEGHHWPGLHAIGMVEAERRIGEERSRARRYYLLSARLVAKAFGEATRSHWGSRIRSTGCSTWLFTKTTAASGLAMPPRTSRSCATSPSTSSGNNTPRI